jgi:hypothetical protein
MPGAVPVWQGTIATLQLQQRFDLVSYWNLDTWQRDAREAVAQALSGLEQRTAIRDAGEVPVLLLRAPLPQD